MKPALKPGLTHRFSYTVPAAKTVPERYIVTWDRFNRSVAAKTAKADAKVDA